MKIKIKDWRVEFGAFWLIVFRPVYLPATMYRYPWLKLGWVRGSK